MEWKDVIKMLHRHDFWHKLAVGHVLLTLQKVLFKFLQLPNAELTCKDISLKRKTIKN